MACGGTGSITISWGEWTAVYTQSYSTKTSLICPGCCINVLIFPWELNMGEAALIPLPRPSPPASACVSKMKKKSAAALPVSHIFAFCFPAAKLTPTCSTCRWLPGHAATSPTSEGKNLRVQTSPAERQTENKVTAETQAALNITKPPAAHTTQLNTSTWKRWWLFLGPYG